MIRERVSAEQFDAFVAQHTDTDYELIGREIVEVVSHSYASHIAAKLLARIGIFVEDNQLGYYTGADGGYKDILEDNSVLKGFKIDLSRIFVDK